MSTARAFGVTAREADGSGRATRPGSFRLPPWQEKGARPMTTSQPKTIRSMVGPDLLVTRFVIVGGQPRIALEPVGHPTAPRMTFDFDGVRGLIAALEAATGDVELCAHCGAIIHRTSEGWTHDATEPSIVYCHDQDDPEAPGTKGEPPLKADAALDALARMLDGTEWSAATLDDLADVVRSTGRPITEPAVRDGAYPADGCGRCGAALVGREREGTLCFDCRDDLRHGEL